ncbi:MAG: hypothetical protein AAGM29_12725, partial [Cyanobacteria bacterium J06588_4]
IDRNRQACGIFKKIVLDLRKYGLEVTTTGIENLSQLNRVKEIAGDYGQGNFLSQPLSAGNVMKVINLNQAVSNRENLN